MMSSSEMMGERRAVKVGDVQSQAPEPENLQCPRCESTNTKFCYYNNYNLSQPRYFCKACRRYWTRGGSLRNIPVGGGTRKNSKRSRSSTSPATSQPLLPAPAVPCNSAAPNDSPANHTNSSPVSFAVKTENTNQNQNPNPAPALSPFRCTDMNLNEALPGSFSSLLGSQQTSGFLGLGGYSLGLGPGSSSGFDMLGFGFGKSAGEWPAMVEIGGENVNGGGSGGVGGSSGGSSSGCNTWQMDGVDGGALTDAGDCFGWPDLAISTPGTAGLE